MQDSRICNICGRKDPTTSAIVKGRWGVYCPECMSLEKRQNSPAKASYDRDRDRENHRKDMLQPWLPNGKPNTEFIRAYPERSDNFTEEELKEYS